MNYKPFNKADYNASDPQSKSKAVTALQQIDPQFVLNTPLSEQKEEYKKWDFTIIHAGKPVRVETEQKRGWTTSDGTFFVSGALRSTLDVPTRKWESQADLYVLFNANFDSLALTPMKTVLGSPVTTKSTRMHGEALTTGEGFFNVPLDQCRFYVVRDGVWQRA